MPPSTDSKLRNRRCYQCDRPINSESENEWCLARLVNEFGEWETNGNGEELLAALCLECGLAIGCRTVAEVKRQAEAEEQGSPQ